MNCGIECEQEGCSTQGEPEQSDQYPKPLTFHVAQETEVLYLSLSLSLAHTHTRTHHHHHHHHHIIIIIVCDLILLTILLSFFQMQSSKIMIFQGL